MDRGANTATRSHYNWTPLTEAAFNGHAEVVRCLLSPKRGFADCLALAACDAEGNNAMELAKSGGDQACTELIEVRDATGR